MANNNEQFENLALCAAWGMICLGPLNFVIFLVTVTVPLFVVEIDTIYGQKMSDLVFVQENGEHYTADGTLLEIQCRFDRFKFKGLIVEDPFLRSINGKEFVNDEMDPFYRPFSASVNSQTCNWRYDPATDENCPWEDHMCKGQNCRLFYKDIQGVGDCIPSGFGGILLGQSWYDSESKGSCDTSFERQAGKGALAMSLLGCLLTPFALFGLVSKNPGTASLGIIPGVCMVGLLVCVIPFGQNNMCGQQGRNGGYVALLCLTFLSVVCSFFVYIINMISLFKHLRKKTKPDVLMVDQNCN